MGDREGIVLLQLNGVWNRDSKIWGEWVLNNVMLGIDSLMKEVFPVSANQQLHYETVDPASAKQPA